MISHGHGIARVTVLAVGILAALLLITYIRAGHNLSNLEPLAGATLQKVEAFLSQAVGQQVQVEKVSGFSIKGLVLEDISSGDYLAETGKAATGLSFHIPRAVIQVNLWRYLWDREISSILVHLDQPDIKMDGIPHLPSSGGDRQPHPQGLSELQIQVVIHEGSFVYTDTVFDEAIMLESINGKLKIGRDNDTQPGTQQIYIEPLECSWGANRLRLQGRLSTEDDATRRANVDLVLTTGDKSRISIEGSVHRGRFLAGDLSLTIEQLQLRELMTWANIWSPFLERRFVDKQREATGPVKSGSGIMVDHLLENGSERPLNGILAGHWRLYGQMDSPQAEGVFSLSSLDWGQVSLGDIIGRMEATGKQIRIDDLQGSFLGGSLTGSGIATGGQEPAYDFRLALHGIKPGIIAILTKAWQWELPAMVMELLPDLQTEVRISSESTLPKLEAVWQTCWQGNEISGTAWLNTDGTYRVQGECQDIPLAELFRQVSPDWPTVPTAGTIDVTGAIYGVWGQSEWSAQLNGKDVVWLIPGIPTAIVIPQVRGQFQDSRIDLTPFDLSCGSGTITVGGTVLLEQLDRPYLDLNAQVKELRYDAGPFTGMLSGELSWVGAWPQPLLTGRLSLQKGRLDLAKLGPMTTPMVDLPVDVDVEIEESLAVTGTGLLDVAVEGSLQINGTTSHPQARGHANVVRGQLVYFGTPFRVVRGWAEFRPYQDLIPDIYLEGCGEIQDLVVTLILRGPGNNMQATLHSEQGLSERELLAMLSIPEKVNTALDGRLGQLFQQEMHQLLKSQLKLYVLGGLEEHLQEALGLDELQLEPGLGDEPVGLEFGKYITQDVFVAYTQTVYPHWENEWHMDYRLNQGLRLSTTWSGDGEYKLGIELKLDF
ncbi:MAG: hypothetical protein GX998_11465 [Firmicutes bacterium]|nr:hypothetical protein [Bacillota bacterium]